MSVERVFPVDIVAVKDYGIQRWITDFFWPISDDAFVGLARDVEGAFTAQVNALPTELAELLLVKRNLSLEYLHLFHALAVVATARSLGFLVHASSGAFWYPDVLEDFRTPRPQAYTKRTVISTLDALRGERWAKVAVRRLRMARSCNVSAAKVWGYAHCTLRHFAYGTLDDFVSHHLRRVPNFISPLSPVDWMPHGIVPTPRVLQAAIGELARTLVGTMVAIAGRHGVTITERVVAHLVGLTEIELSDAAAALAILHEHVQRRSGLAHLFLTAVGNPLQRALSIANRRGGGTVTSFTHGGHLGLYDNPGLALSEFAIADEFVGYTAGTIPLFRRMLANHPPVRGNRVQIVAAEYPGYRDLWRRLRVTPPPSGVRTVMLIGCPQSPWRTHLIAASLPLMELHLELQIVEVLQQHGFAVIYKAHPDRLTEIRGVFDGRVPVIDGYFERHLDQADAFVFPTLRTTAFPLALCTNKPVVSFLVQPEPYKPVPEAMVKLEKRCTFVRATFDGRNRLQFDSDELLRALMAQPIIPDMEFVETYMFPGRREHDARGRIPLSVTRR